MKAPRLENFEQAAQLCCAEIMRMRWWRLGRSAVRPASKMGAAGARSLSTESAARVPTNGAGYVPRVAAGSAPRALLRASLSLDPFRWSLIRSREEPHLFDGEPGQTAEAWSPSLSLHHRTLYMIE